MSYVNRAVSAQKGLAGGYKPKIYFAPVADITTMARPAASPAAAGDKVKITTAHVFATSKAANIWDAKLHSFKHTSTTVGDDGALEFQHNFEVEVLGDNPATFEQLKDMMNDQLVVWAQDADCIENDSYIQLGDDCVPVEVKVEFDGKTTKEGQKVYKITFTSKKKFFYLSTLDVTP